MEGAVAVYEEGSSFYRKLEKMDMDSLRLGSEVVYNIICMASEALLSALLLQHNEELEHGSVSSMLRAASKHMPVSDELMNEARFMNKFHTWCSLDLIPSKQASPDELKRMVLCVKQIREAVSGKLIR